MATVVKASGCWLKGYHSRLPLLGPWARLLNPTPHTTRSLLYMQCRSQAWVGNGRVVTGRASGVKHVLDFARSNEAMWHESDKAQEKKLAFFCVKQKIAWTLIIAVFYYLCQSLLRPQSQKDFPTIQEMDTNMQHLTVYIIYIIVYYIILFCIRKMCYKC